MVCLLAFCSGMVVSADSAVRVGSKEVVLSFETFQLENGDSLVTIIYEDQRPAQIRGAVNQRSGHKTVKYNTAGGTAFTYTVYGTFQYDGSSAKAVNASDDYEILQSDWRCTTHSASISGASAKGTANFRHTDGTTKKLSASLTCTASGTLR